MKRLPIFLILLFAAPLLAGEPAQRPQAPDLASLLAASQQADAELASAQLDETKAKATAEMASQATTAKRAASDKAAAAFIAEWGRLHPGPSPIPVPPNPPPTPPDPTPVPPTPTTGPLRVMFTYDPTALSKLGPERAKILISPQLLAYLDAHCPMESNCPDGSCPLLASNKHSYRYFPKGTDVSLLTKIWADSYAVVKDKPIPWFMVIDAKGQVVVSQEWPATVAETLEILKKWGGA